jgi:hypothetical protein
MAEDVRRSDLAFRVLFILRSPAEEPAMTRLSLSLSALIAAGVLVATPALAVERCGFKAAHVMASVPEAAPVSTSQSAATEAPVDAATSEVAQSSTDQTKAN